MRAPPWRLRFVRGRDLSEERIDEAWALRSALIGLQRQVPVEVDRAAFGRDLRRASRVGLIVDRQDRLQGFTDLAIHLEPGLVVMRGEYGFVAPAWLYSAGTHAALRELGFTVAEDHLSVWRPTDGKVVHRSPVVSYASRDRRRVLGSLVWSRTASIALAPLSVVRHAIHPHDLDVPSLEAEIERSLRDFLTTRTPLSYEGLAAA